VIKLVLKWYETAEKLLDQGDEIQNCYEGKMNGKHGWLIISNRKVIFLRETGFISKDYSPILEKYRDDIEKVTKIGVYKFIISDTLGKTFTFNTSLTAENILRNLESSVEAPIMA
jgi:hypothetical protein